MPVHSLAYSGNYATLHAWSVQQVILRTPQPCLKSNRKMRLVPLPCVAMQLLLDIMQPTPVRMTNWFYVKIPIMHPADQFAIQLQCSFTIEQNSGLFHIVQVSDSPKLLHSHTLHAS